MWRASLKCHGQRYTDTLLKRGVTRRFGKWTELPSIELMPFHHFRQEPVEIGDEAVVGVDGGTACPHREAELVGRRLVTGREGLSDLDGAAARRDDLRRVPLGTRDDPTSTVPRPCRSKGWPTTAMSG